jgi:hypothetical protein
MKLSLIEQMDRAVADRDYYMDGGERQAHQHGEDILWLLGYADNSYEVELIQEKGNYILNSPEAKWN